MLIKTSQVSRFVVNTFRRMNPTVRLEPYLCLNEQYVLYCNYCRKKLSRPISSQLLGIEDN
jgi:hypothetical protein